MCVSYVDDLVWVCKDQQVMDDMIRSFNEDGDKHNWEHTTEGDLHSFLGVQIEEITKVENGKTIKGWKFTQNKLIEKDIKSYRSHRMQW